LKKYLFGTTTACQNFKPNLSGLLAMYWMHLQCAEHGNNYSYTVMLYLLRKK